MSEVSTMIMDLGHSSDLKGALSNNQQEAQQSGSEFSKMVEQHIIDEKGGKNKPLPLENNARENNDNNNSELEASNEQTSSPVDNEIDKHTYIKGETQETPKGSGEGELAQQAKSIENDNNDVEGSTSELLALLDASDKALQHDKQTEVAKSVHQAILASQQKQSSSNSGGTVSAEQNSEPEDSSQVENDDSAIKQGTVDFIGSEGKKADHIAKDIIENGQPNKPEVTVNEEAKHESDSTNHDNRNTYNSLINEIKANENKTDGQALPSASAESDKVIEKILQPVQQHNNSQQAQEGAIDAIANDVQLDEVVDAEALALTGTELKQEKITKTVANQITDDKSKTNDDLKYIQPQVSENNKIATETDDVVVSSAKVIDQKLATPGVSENNKVNQTTKSVVKDVLTQSTTVNDDSGSVDTETTNDTQVSKEALVNSGAQQKSESWLTDNKAHANTVDSRFANSAIKGAETNSAVVQQSVTDTLVQNNVSEITRNNREVTALQTETIAIYRKDFANEVKEKVMVMINQKLQRVDIQLDPPELGNVSVRVNLQGEQAAVNFVVQNQQAKDALEQNLTKLREMLSENGVDVGDANVEQQQQNGQQELAEQNSNGNYLNSAEGDKTDVEPMIQHNLYKASATGVDYFA